MHLLVAGSEIHIACIAIEMKLLVHNLSNQVGRDRGYPSDPVKRVTWLERCLAIFCLLANNNYNSQTWPIGIASCCLGFIVLEEFGIICDSSAVYKKVSLTLDGLAMYISLD